jgi:tetratricopeptide (TPR) repeat protein
MTRKKYSKAQGVRKRPPPGSPTWQKPRSLHLSFIDVCEGNVLRSLGNAYDDLGDVRKAIGYLEQALEIAREIGDRRGEGNALGNLRAAYHRLGEVRKAIGYYEQALEIDREIGDRRGEGADLANMGQAYKKLGDVAKARELWEEALRILEAIEDPRAEWVRGWLGELS